MVASPFAETAFFLAGASLLVFLLHRWRPEIRPLLGAAYAALVLAFFGPILLSPRHLVATDIPYRWQPWLGETVEPVVPQNHLLSDPPLQLYPMWRLAREHLLAGQPPLWAHGLSTGEPLAGLAQAAPFAPLRLLTIALPPLSGLDVAAALQVLVALLLMHALAARLGASPLAASFAAIAFGFSSYAVAWLAYPLGTAPMWLPGVVLGILCVHRGERGALAALVVCAWSLAASGHPETVGHTALVCALLAVALLWRRDVPRLPFLRRLAVATLLTAGFAAPVLLPVIEALPDSQRWNQMHHAPDSVDPPPFSLAVASLVVNPLRLGSARDNDYSGPTNWNEDATGYAGLLTLALALVGGANRQRWPILLGGLAALGVALAVGPLLAAMKLIPVLGIGAHGRLRWLWIFTAALCAAWGLDLARQQGRHRATTAAVFCTAIAFAVLAPDFHAPVRGLWFGAVLLGTLGTAACLAIARFRPALPAVALVTVVTDLLLLGAHYNPRVPDALALRMPASLADLTAPNDHDPAARSRRVTAQGEDLYPNLGSLYGLWDPRPNDPMVSWAVKAFLDRTLPRAYRVSGRARPVRENPQPALDYLRVGTLLTRGRREMPPPWTVSRRSPGLKVWTNPGVLPLFHLPRNLRHVESQGKALQGGVRIHDYADTAFLEGDVASLPKAEQSGSLELAAIDLNGFHLTATGGGGVAVSSVTYARGWRAVVAGRRSPTWRANGAFLAFELLSGEHSAVLRFLPSTWILGMVLASLASTAGLGFLRPPCQPR